MAKDVNYWTQRNAEYNKFETNQARNERERQKLIAERPEFLPFDQDAIDGLHRPRMRQFEQYRQDIVDGDTAAQRQLQAQTQQIQGNAMSGASARGFSPSAARSGSYAASQAGMRGAQQRQAVRAGEMQNLNLMGQDAEQAVSGAYMQGMGRQQDYIGQQWQQQGSRELREAKQYAQEMAQDDATADAVMGAVGSMIGAVSDERLKNTHPSRTDDQDALEALDGVSATPYRYKDEAQERLGLTPRTQWGPMAQELEEHPVTRSVVHETPEGKVIDTKAATMQQYGMLAALGRRLDEIERKKRGGR